MGFDVSMLIGRCGLFCGGVFGGLWSWRVALQSRGLYLFTGRTLRLGFGVAGEEPRLSPPISSPSILLFFVSTSFSPFIFSFVWWVTKTTDLCRSKFMSGSNECRSKREMPSLYPQAKGILNAFKDKGIDMAISSRSPTPGIANTFLDKLNIKPMFVAKEIFSSWTHKTEHFQKIHSRTEVSKMGVTSILVDNGVNLGALREGLTKFTQNVKTTEKNILYFYSPVIFSLYIFCFFFYIYILL
ncbi:hypothetical protein Tsubulata_036371 [Turnera subulata]|uniref:Uncharacterized protein n=1 Tax=Turnera subulata TaxID=218843 RepID=A0A9Q0G4I4_9ROSI|nr:hypothetical protein Tsubulata_036371 [Turnera subulata]